MMEPAVAYLRAAQGSHDVDAVSDFFDDRFAVMSLIRAGVPFELFSAIQEWVPFSESTWARVLDISTKSLQRYAKSKATFKRLQSEKILEMAEVAYLGLDVFGDQDKFWLWLETPLFALANRKPIDLLEDSYGKEMVMETLVRMDQGIFI